MNSLNQFPFRIGHGYDVHRLTDGRKLFLAGVEIPHTHGLLGHSDADVAIHALCDALLGAIAAGDIGHLFPDTDNSFKDIDSKILLRKVVEVVKNAGYSVGNVDITIVAQAPKIAPYITRMRESIANCLSVDSQCVSIKATTTEHLGFEGRKEGISSTAVAILYRF